MKVASEDAALHGLHHLLSVGTVGQQDVTQVLLDPVNEVGDEDHVVTTLLS